MNIWRKTFGKVSGRTGRGRIYMNWLLSYSKLSKLQQILRALISPRNFSYLSLQKTAEKL